MRAALAIALLFCGRYAAASWFDPRRDADLAWQRWLGQYILAHRHLPRSLGPETFTSAGAHWVPQEWALSLAVALAPTTWAFAALAALATLAGGAAMLITALCARRMGASTLVTIICVTCVGYSMVESYGIRAQVFGWALLAAIMFVLRCANGRNVWWVVVLTAVWANLHASAVLAPLIAGIWTAGIALEDRALTGRIRMFAGVTALSAVAVCATPLGVQLPLYAAQLFASPIRFIIQEWQPLDFISDSFTFGAFPLVAAAIVWGIGKPHRWSEIFVFAVSTWLLFTAVRNVPVCAIMIAPAVAQAVTRALPQRLRINELLAERPVLVMLNAVAAAGAVAIVLDLARLPSYYEGKLPYRPVASIAAVAGTHNLYCEDFAWCSLALPYANLREFIDGRCDPFPLSVWSQYEAVYRLKPRWRAILDAHRVDAVLVEVQRPLARALTSGPHWRLLYADARYDLFIRADNEKRTAYQ
jgi:hypothetical protein